MEMKGSSGVDDRTFRVIFGEEGVRKLKATLSEKLKEFMGDYTDDTLVEYVIVLLRNGHRKDEAKNELDVFLGDSTDFFVTWLWDHLVSNIDQYVLPPESKAEVPKARPAKTERAGKNAPHNDTDPDSGTGMHEMSPKTRQPREWKGVSRKVALTSAIDCSDVGKSVRNEGRLYSEAHRRKHSVSPEPIGRRKRSCAEEPRQSEESVPRGSIRLLQFAVRDAVASSVPSHSTSEPASKRLRSVVSSSIANTTYETHPQRPFSVAGVPNPMETSNRNVVEASEDVKQKNKASGNVFDRLSRGVDEEESSRQVSTLMVDEFDDFNRIQEGAHEMDHLTTFYVGKYVGPMTWMEGTEKHDNSMMQNSVADNAIKARHPSHPQTPVSSVALANSSSKIVNISVNLNTRKPVHYLSSVGAKGPGAQNSMQLGDTVTGNSRMTLLTGNSNFLKHAGKGNAAVEKQKNSPFVSGSYTVIPHLDDANSRTIFVNNVHFAASKKNLSHHFSKFGEVLKATILTDPATGQPKGSAYVEFVRKEVAEDALSLHGTSFMSRILKVVRKSAAHHETTRSTSFPPVIRGSAFAVPRIARATFPRVFHGAYRARPLLKPGARSLQWKRDAQPTSAEGPTSSSSLRSVVPSPFPRSLTYVRPDSNADTNRIAM